MARVNQGVFKKYLEQYRELSIEYDTLMEQYELEISVDFFDGLAQSSGDLYDRMDEFLGEFRGMLNSTKFEEETGNAQKYENMFNEIEVKQRNLKKYFNDWVKQIEAGGGLYDIEIRTIDGYKIWDR